MSKMSEIDADRQQIDRLTDVERPPSFAVSGRAGLAARRCARSPGDLRGSCLACGADSEQACLRAPEVF